VKRIGAFDVKELSNKILKNLKGEELPGDGSIKRGPWSIAGATEKRGKLARGEVYWGKTYRKLIDTELWRGGGTWRKGGKVYTPKRSWARGN